MEGSSLASSLQSPTADDSVPFSYPSWVLLDKNLYFAHHESAPTKKVKTSTGKEVEISICLADPPAASCFCVHSPNIREEDYTSLPRIVSSAENLVLLSFAFKTGPRSTEVDSDLVEFFVCKAGSGGDLSIEPVPYSPTGTRHSCHACIVPRDGGNYLVADLSPREGNLGHFDLYVFSSETSKWTSTYLQLPAPALALPRDLPSVLHKVISLGGSVVGWVDLWRGIIFCDILLEKKPVLRFIPLPTTAFNLHREGNAQKVRDVTCCNGYISFVEIKHCFRELSIANSRSFKMTQHLDTEDLILDEAFFTRDDLDKKPVLVHDGWKIRTMYKAISWDYWKKKHTVHFDDIVAVPELSSVLLPQLWNGGAMEFTLRNLKTAAFPFFGVYDDNVVYLMYNVQSDDDDSWAVGVDLETKKLEVIKPYWATIGSSSGPTVLSCAFSEYMNATPRPYDELVAASSSQNRVLNNHLPMGDTIPVANSAENGVPNNHLPLGVTILGNVQPQRNTLNVDGYHGSWNGSGYGCYQQPTQLQPPNLPPTVQPTSPSTRSGYIYARWTVPDSNGRMLITVPLDAMKRPIAAPLVLLTPPVPSPNSWPQDQDAVP
uniref:Uncharacterized protein n=1 Tax=Avena sativa TaxID=4498 RepID=A0ACD5YB61_AVESA